MNTITLKPAKDKSLVRRHPWIYANAIEHVEGKPAPGATVLIRAHDGRFLARASYSPVSQIRARVWSFDETEPIDHAFFKRRVQRASDSTFRCWGSPALPRTFLPNWRSRRSHRSSCLALFMPRLR